MAPKLSELDLLLNKAALQQAKLREALGIKIDDVDDAESRRKEDEMFKCEPELAGLGYKAKDDSAARKKLEAASAENKLRRQLLQSGGKRSSQNSSTRLQGRVGVHDDSDSDEDEGRAASFQARKPKVVKVSTTFKSQEALDSDGGDEQAVLAQTVKPSKPSESSAPSRKRASASYLDEILAEKAKKRKKKRKKNNANPNSTE